MRIAVDLCGFTVRQAGTLRKATGKKKVDAVREMSDGSVTGAAEHGLGRLATVSMTSMTWR